MVSPYSLRNSWLIGVDAAQLQAAKPIDPKRLSINANPVDFNAVKESSKAPASEQLKNLEQRLDSLQNEWLSNLNGLLDDPFINLRSAQTQPSAVNS